ncbi:MAG: hypothetical protein JRG89_10940 [Deltaproteobacteria bacterium]|jgi:hypothetical protein|nr:hypothetical protein [Deltaproteobacteria bacterium]MBW2388939.1 hypothetical protein [Deltaproteobacteria bacterium]
MNYYTRRQLVDVLQVGDDFLISLEEEEIVTRDAPDDIAGEFSEIMFERVRVAANLVEELEVNLPGVAVIIRMREEMAGQRRAIEEFVIRLRSST